jgi:hypothetical protein
MPKKKEEKKASVFSVELDTGVKKYQYEGETILDCLTEIKGITPIKTFNYLSASNGKRSLRIMLVPIRLRRFLASKDYRQILAKQLTRALQ